MKASYLGGFLFCTKLNMLISISDGRFPRAWLQSPHHFVLPGPSAHAPAASLSVQKTSANPAGKIRAKGFGPNLCDEASEAMQEQMFYAVFH